MNKKKISVRCMIAILFSCVLFVNILFINQKEVYAGTYDNAIEYYNTYGNSIVFIPSSDTDGGIYYGTKANLSPSAYIRYKNVGWKVTMTTNDGTFLQNIYFKIGGSYMNKTSSIQKDGYQYDLFCISLSTLKSRMNETTKAHLASGNCRIIFNSCTIVITGKTWGGDISDNGPIYGNVYETYNGIVNAAGWSNATKEALYSFYDKEVTGLFYSVSIGSGTGIESVSGEGYYCYGTTITISANPQEGYQFQSWTGSITSLEQTTQIIVNKNMSITALGTPKTVTVTFHRNWDIRDYTILKQTFSCIADGQSFSNKYWIRAGYQLIGWAHNKNASEKQYDVLSQVTSDWVEKYHPSVHLYAVWKANQYTLIFDGNGADKGTMLSETKDYTKSIVVPENEYSFSENTCTFLGWSLDANATVPSYTPGQSVSIKDLVQVLKLENMPGGTIRFYAIWDEAPSVVANDLYYSLEDAQNGRITETLIAQTAKAYDKEDGEIAYGIQGNSKFVIIDYQSEDYTLLMSDGMVTQTFEVVDSVGNRMTRMIEVHIVDTTPVVGKDLYGDIRFVSEEYYSEIYFMENSVWINQPDYRTRIEALWQRMN